METAPQIDFQGMEPSDAVRDQIVNKIARLEDHYGRVTACRIIVKAPGAHHRTGGQYDINIHLVLPDKREVSVGRTPTPDERFQDLDFALNDAFKRARRQLQDEVGRIRGEVKHHLSEPVGVVKTLIREEGYGFLESADGREIYFHENSVSPPGFDSLRAGERVNFIESDEGRQGPQASRVRPLRESAPE